MKNIPKVIYLNVGFDNDEIDIKNEDFKKLIGVSWSDTKINDQDLRYELSEQQQPTETKQESKSDVTQQRELLIAFCNHLSKQELQTTYWLDESDVDEFLKSNMTKEKLFNLTEGIKHLKEGKKIRKKSWRKTFSWIEYSSEENLIIRHDGHGIEVKIYKDVDLDNPGKSNDMEEEVWEVYDYPNFD